MGGKLNTFIFSFDKKNKFSLALNNISYEDKNLLELLFGGMKYGASFILKNDHEKHHFFLGPRSFAGQRNHQDVVHPPKQNEVRRPGPA